MNENIAYQKAIVLMERGFKHQMRGELGDAIELYESSILLHPTAEAHTHLGWTYGMMGRFEDAIETCEKAIELDPGYGNPYNDIGSYLIELGQLEEAQPWMEKALAAERYKTPHHALINLGRVNQRSGRYKTALEFYNEALAHEPFDRTALNLKYALLGRLN